MHPSAEAGIVSIAILFVGCGETPPEPTVPVTGRLTLDGQPVAGASIDFVPENGRAAATAIADENGEFTMATFSRGDGAVVGTHTVTVLPSYSNPDGGAIIAGQASKSMVPGRYSTPQTTPFQFEVQKDEENHFELEMTRQEQKS